MSGSFTRHLLGVTRHEEVARARREMERDRETLLADLARDDRAFETEMRRREGVSHIVLGEGARGVPYRVPVAMFDGTHSWWSAGTGSGKTRSTAALVDALSGHLVGGEPIAIIVIGLQGNMGDLTLRALGARLRTAPPARRDAVLSRLLTAQFFRGKTLPEWNFLAPSPHVPALVQASAIAEVLENSLGALGGRQETAFSMLLGLAVEQGLPINALRLLLTQPAALQTLARRSAEPLITSYIEHRFARESAATIDGLGSRIDRLLSLDAGIRGSFAGPGTIDFAHCFAAGAVSVFDLAGTPLGAEGARRVIAALIIQYLAFAAVSSARVIRGHTIIVLDEAQLGFTPATVRTLETLLTTVRQFRVGLHFVNQSLVQVPREFQQLLNTNLRWRFLGRSGAEDGHLSRAFLPRTGRVARPRPPFGPPPERTEFLSRSEEEASRIDALGRMPARHFLATENEAPFGTREIIASAFDPPAWETFPPDLRRALEAGATGVPRSELIERGRRIEAETLARAVGLAGEAGGSTPSIRRTRAEGVLPATPDAVARASGWSRRRGKKP